ncbi:MAG: hypothetical protein FJ014_18980, partial [Chloroflexi bacterium]|nr:hypothetical protein [Chloroflexota bacterium]
MEDGRWRAENGRWRMENGEWRMERGGGRMESVSSPPSAIHSPSSIFIFYLPSSTPMQDRHVVIIGASTAGLFAAYLLAKEGLAVRLYEQGETLGPPARTLIVTSQINQVLGFVPTEAIVNRVQHIELFSRHASARVSLQQPDLIVERAQLIHLLAARARQAGAAIELGYKFLGLERDGDGLLV